MLRAAREGYRSRAAYKLKDIHAKTGILRNQKVALEIGAAPGSWSQVLTQAGVRVVGVDVLPVVPMVGATFVKGDFTQPSVQDALLKALGGPVDLLLSDVSPNRSGQRSLDVARIISYVEGCLSLAQQCLRPGGTFVCKLLQSAETQQLLKTQLKPSFGTGALMKPPSSRARSAEVYFCGRDFQPAALSEDQTRQIDEVVRQSRPGPRTRARKVRTRSRSTTSSLRASPSDHG